LYFPYRKLADHAISLRQNSQALLLKSQLLLAENNPREATQLALKAVEAGGEQEEDEPARLAVIRCQLEESGSSKSVKEAHQQLGFLRDAHPAVLELSVGEVEK
jgi:hypothetical protein